MTEQVKEVLKEAEEANLTAIVTVGIGEDGKVQLRSSANNVAVMHWLLNKGLFELNVFEMNQRQAEPAAE